MKKFILCLLVQALAFPLAAQKRGKASPYVAPSISATIKQYEDSLQALRRQFANWHYTEADTLDNPYYSYLFSSPTFYGSPVHRTIGQLHSDLSPSASGCEDGHTGRIFALTRRADRELMEVYATAPWLIRHEEMQDAGTDNGIRTDLETEVKPSLRLSERYAQDEIRPEADNFANDLQIMVRRPNFWNFKTNFSMQFLQNYVSDNWYKGGENYTSFLTALTVEANYDNKQRITFSNKLEMKLGFQASHEDDKHKFKTNSDLLRLTNKLGLKATKHWYYTLMLQSWTQFYRGYKSNDEHVYSDFMSPFESLFSLGMDYKLNVKNLEFNATISPFACDFKYVDRLYLATAFGIDAGKHDKFTYGSNITANYKWTICKNVQWQGRIYFFTDYSTAQVEWENTFNLKINRFLSTKLFLYPRFDDGVPRTEGNSYFQFNEYLSVGLDLSF